MPLHSLTQQSGAYHMSGCPMLPRLPFSVLYLTLQSPCGICFLQSVLPSSIQPLSSPLFLPLSSASLLAQPGLQPGPWPLLGGVWSWAV